MTDIEKICSENNILNDFVSAKPMDPENRIFKNNFQVIKVYYPKKHSYYVNELEVYKNLRDKTYISEIYGYGEIDNFKYIIMKKLTGISLFDAWDTISKEEKRNVVKQVTEIIKDINNIRIEEKYFIKDFEKQFLISLNQLEDDDLKIELKYYFDLLKSNFELKEKCNLIHVDAHFYNFMYNAGEVFAYDFERTLMAPRDYQLTRWYRMWKYPQDYYYPKNSLTEEKISSYSILMPVLLENYPEMKNNENLVNRVSLYELDYLVKEINRCKLSRESIDRYIEEAKVYKLNGKY